MILIYKNIIVQASGSYTSCTHHCTEQARITGNKPIYAHFHVRKHTQQAQNKRTNWSDICSELLVQQNCLTSESLWDIRSFILCLIPHVLTLIVEQSMLHYLSSRIVWNTQAHWSVWHKLANALKRSLKYKPQVYAKQIT